MVLLYSTVGNVCDLLLVHKTQNLIKCWLLIPVCFGMVYYTQIFDYVDYNTVKYLDSPPSNCQPQIENASGAVVASWFLKGSAQDSRK